MKITYIHHSSFLVETDSCYYLFDYEKGSLPAMDVEKPILVLSSHGHHDHYNPEVFALLEGSGMQKVYGILSDDIDDIGDSDDIAGGACAEVLQVAPGKEYTLYLNQKLTTFRSTDLGVAFLIEDGEALIYHAGDLNDWVWAEESDAYNAQMTLDYREQIDLLADLLAWKLNRRAIDAAFVVLDPRQEKDYDRGLCYFLEHIPVKEVYPMHYWGKPEIIGRFLENHPQYQGKVRGFSPVLF